MPITYNVDFDTLMGIITDSDFFTNTTTAGNKSDALNICNIQCCELKKMLDYTITSFPSGVVNNANYVIVPDTTSSIIQTKATLLGLTHNDLVSTSDAVQSLNHKYFTTGLNYGIAFYDTKCIVTKFNNNVSDAEQITFIFNKDDPKYKITENYYNGLWNSI